MALLFFVALTLGVGAATRLVYSTGFDAPPFDPVYSLDDQDGWVATGSGGTGLFSDGVFSGPSAFVGLYPPTNTNTETTVWHPLDIDPVAERHPVVTFSVGFVIWDSTTNAPGADEFRWSVVNRSGQPLCQLLLDNYRFHISYLGTDGVTPVDTLSTFQTNTQHTLRMRLDFLSNRWSATLSNHLSGAVALLATNLTMAGPGVALDLGDIDASWVVSDFLNPGDNFMEFDGYQVEAQGPGDFRVTGVALSPGGGARVRVEGEEGARFLVESSSDPASTAGEWTWVGAGVVQAGSLEVADAAGGVGPARFYRARWVP